ncbi:pro-neuregulin-1, membrane-bound isoform-like [Brachyhypopomus gauderio]|uniref:pro-neuregulin-1, membrane-bound isoform-like n=1 Tax=Brachyhypopomus gauderio TaxID=698409 RepID=UPI00404105E8
MSGKSKKGGKGGKKGQKEDVPAAPKLKAVRSVTVSEGQKTILKCELLAGGRQTTLKWYQNRMEIDATKTRKIRMKKRGTVSELHLTKATESDGGEYQCKAINGHGEDQQSGNVTVIRVIWDALH